jgi:formate hydrogenlyase subunit 3/multisubunit Na+/H+ antiporter MnhD subunit
MIETLYIATLIILVVCCIMSTTAFIKLRYEAQKVAGWVSIIFFITWAVVFIYTIDYLDTKENTPHCIQVSTK